MTKETRKNRAPTMKKQSKKRTKSPKNQWKRRKPLFEWVTMGWPPNPKEGGLSSRVPKLLFQMFWTFGQWYQPRIDAKQYEQATNTKYITCRWVSCFTCIIWQRMFKILNETFNKATSAQGKNLLYHPMRLLRWGPEASRQLPGHYLLTNQPKVVLWVVSPL